MNTHTPRRFIIGSTLLLLVASQSKAGLIELFESETGGNVTLAIEGNALRLTDNAGGTGVLRIISTPGSGATTAEDLGFAGDWPALTIRGVPLQNNALLPSTRLEDLFDGAGISSSGNSLKEISILDSNGLGFTIDIDLVDTIGGPVPEPGTFSLLILSSAAMLKWRYKGD